jgi:hypothetical protein
MIWIRVLFWTRVTIATTLMYWSTGANLLPTCNHARHSNKFLLGFGQISSSEKILYIYKYTINESNLYFTTSNLEYDPPLLRENIYIYIYIYR